MCASTKEGFSEVYQFKEAFKFKETSIKAYTNQGSSLKSFISNNELRINDDASDDVGNYVGANNDVGDDINNMLLQVIMQITMLVQVMM